MTVTFWNSGDPTAATCGWPTSRGPCYLGPNHDADHDGAYVGESPTMSRLPIDPALAALIAEQAIDLFIENRDVHGHDEARAKREAITGVSEGASTPLPKRELAPIEAYDYPHTPAGTHALIQDSVRFHMGDD